jgi:molybdate transport system substrate-binding protein
MSVLEAAPVQLSVPPVDEVQDLHGDPSRHDLALFMHGNQWMVMDVLLREFQALHPEIGSIYYETLPPGILMQQMRQGTLRVGELVVRVAPDVLTAGISTLAGLADEDWLEQYHDYAANTLAILVQRGNPHGIAGWSDLLLPQVRVVLPNPETEGIGRLIRDAVVETLGPDAWTELAHRKLERGAAMFTQVHHRETPLQLLAGAMDAGPVWLTEALYQRRLGMPLEAVRLPEEQNRRGRYGVAIVTRTTTHPEAADAFVSFLRGPAAQAVYADYGFEGAGDAGAEAQNRLREL